MKHKHLRKLAWLAVLCAVSYGTLEAQAGPRKVRRARPTRPLKARTRPGRPGRTKTLYVRGYRTAELLRLARFADIVRILGAIGGKLGGRLDAAGIGRDQWVSDLLGLPDAKQEDIQGGRGKDGGRIGKAPGVSLTGGLEGRHEAWREQVRDRLKAFGFDIGPGPKRRATGTADLSLTTATDGLSKLDRCKYGRCGGRDGRLMAEDGDEGGDAGNANAKGGDDGANADAKGGDAAGDDLTAEDVAALNRGESVTKGDTTYFKSSKKENSGSFWGSASRALGKAWGVIAGDSSWESDQKGSDAGVGIRGRPSPDAAGDTPDVKLPPLWGIAWSMQREWKPEGGQPRPCGPEKERRADAGKVQGRKRDNVLIRKVDDDGTTGGVGGIPKAGRDTVIDPERDGSGGKKPPRGNPGQKD